MLISAVCVNMFRNTKEISYAGRLHKNKIVGHDQLIPSLSTSVQPWSISVTVLMVLSMFSYGLSKYVYLRLKFKKEYVF